MYCYFIQFPHGNDAVWRKLQGKILKNVATFIVDDG